ncbi:hypothetical protein ACQP2Y_11640 [Actinoplanes sp. CA-051413]|uniref:hypothetical protein n=1 Tax=Actinoplanes sp. CA-051413 TaxID=3239899 RepID=UPI003D95AEF5
MSDASRRVHHTSHRSLIQPSAPGGRRASVDAIIVPSARSAGMLGEAGRLAVELGCALLVLSSKHSEAEKVFRYLTDRGVNQVIAVDFPRAGVPRLPELETSTVLGRSRLQRRTDTSAKRNLGLVLARVLGWKNVVFLDDDITVPKATDLELAAGALPGRDGVGLHIGGYPDNSVVCHANRVTGAPQSTFIGGGALVVPADRMDSFFPEIYNEDWFFLLGKTMLRPVSQVGTALQKPYDPFANPDRARREEFGDVLAEGLFALFDDGQKIGDAGPGYWTEYLATRLELIMSIQERLDPSETQGKQILESLTAARGRLQFITADQCTEYIAAWQRDRVRWRGFMNGMRPIRRLPAGMTPVDVALTRFGLQQVTWWTGAPRRPAPTPTGSPRERVAVA